MERLPRMQARSCGQVHRKWGDTPYPVQYVYDEHGRMTELHTFRSAADWSGPAWPAAPGQADVTTWVYDEATGLLEQKIYDDGQGPSYTYDAAGRLQTRTWARTVGGDHPVTTYTYDPAGGQLTGVQYSDSTPDVAYTYTRTGQKHTVTDAAGSRSFTYTSLLQPDTETLDAVFYSGMKVKRDYDALGRAETTTVTTSADALIHSAGYAYDTFGRMSQVSSSDFPIPAAVTYTYLAGSNLLHQTSLPNGAVRTRAYEPDRNLIDYVRNTANGATVSQYDYTNDPVGRRTHVVMTGTAFASDSFNHYSHNDRSEVIGGAKYLGTDTLDMTNPVTTYDYAYQYDPIGNRLTYSDAGAVTSYTANSLNQYTAISTLTDPVHDADGNMTLMPSSAGDWALTWNGENRLVAAQSAARRLEFSYDYMGRRVEKVTFTGSPGNWTLDQHLRFVYDGWNLVAELDASGAAIRTYTWGLDLSQSLQGAGGVGGLLAVAEHGGGNSAAFYATYDANGNVSEYLDASGAVAAHYEYSPFGRLTAATGAKAADFVFRFSTKYLDESTGLYYYGLRYYSAELGRWISRDPIGELGGINVYQHTLNSPLILVDKLGMFPCRWVYPGYRVEETGKCRKMEHLITQWLRVIIPNPPLGITDGKDTGILIPPSIRYRYEWHITEIWSAEREVRTFSQKCLICCGLLVGCWKDTLLSTTTEDCDNIEESYILSPGAGWSREFPEYPGWPAPDEPARPPPWRQRDGHINFRTTLSPGMLEYVELELKMHRLEMLDVMS